ncbi:MAG: InlB B-repeat-containing protein [Clostridia bacterium]|nr:InlB B-repeat-containing protein [Clostridia bacterium]
MNKAIKVILTIVVVVLIVALTAGMVTVLVKQSAQGTRSPVYSARMIEAGEEFDPMIFLRDQDRSFTVSEDSVYNVNLPGDYTLQLIMDDSSVRTVTLQVRDTVAPKVTGLPVLLVKKGGGLLPEDLVPSKYVDDVTKVSVSFLGAVDTATEGLHSISLRVEDTSGNTTKAEASFYVTDALVSGYTHEIGNPLPAVEALLPGCSAMLSGEEAIPTVPGRVEMRVEVFGGEYVLYYTAVDTIAPQGVLKSEIGGFYVGNTLPEDPTYFVESITDATAVSVSYAEDYVLDRAEQKQISILLTDLGGNVTTLTLTLSVFEDGEGEDRLPPVISGVKDLETALGVAPNYLEGVSVYDGRDGAIAVDRIKVDSSAVKLNAISTGRGYPVTYSVVDAAGNVATVTAYVKVVRPSVSEEQLEACFDEIMANLKTEGLSRFSVLSMVYEYVTEHYRFSSETSNTDGSDYRTEAYWGFTVKNGNYKTYTAMTAVILERLNIDYFVVNRQQTGSEPHSWLLVDYGIGWLYMDTAPLEGYVWTKSGKLYRESDPEAANLSAADIRKRTAMTDGDIASLTSLLNGFVPGWNYYKADISGGILPVTATRGENGGYISPKYKITYQSSSPNGKIEGQAVQTVTHGAKSTTVTAVATNPAYRFVRWSDGLTTATRSDVVTKITTLTAEFEMYAIDKHTVVYKATEGGSISGTTTQNKRYNEVTALVTAVPAEGYYFVGWSDGLTTASRTDRVVGDAEYTANFAPMMILNYKSEQGGSISGKTIQTLIPGTKGSSVIAVPDKGYLFVSWSDGITTAERQDTSTVSMDLTATFKKDTGSYGLFYMAGQNGRIEGSALQTVPCWEQGTPVSAVPDEGYRFVRWSDGLTLPTRSDLVLENTTLTAFFEKIPIFELIYEAADGGRIEGEALQTVMEGESGMAVTAVPDEGYEFVSWSDGNTEPTRQDAPVADLTVTAVFRERPKPEPVVYTLTYLATEGGTVQGEALQQVVLGEQGSEVTAVAEEGYRFVSWSDGSTQATRSDVASENLTLTAVFEQIDGEQTL